MTNFNELQEETREIITDLLNDGSDPDALYIIEHHIAHYDFASTFSALKEVGYERAVALESFLYPDPETAARRALEKINSYLK